MEEVGFPGVTAQRGEWRGGQILGVQWRLWRRIDEAIVAGGQESADEQDGLNLTAAQFAPRVDVQDSHITGQDS
jgi:hypothetical protein